MVSDKDKGGEQDEVGYAGSTWVGKKVPKYLRNEVCEKGCRNKPLTEEQNENDRRKSRVCSRIAFHSGRTNLVYNLCRYSILQQKELAEG